MCVTDIFFDLVVFVVVHLGMKTCDVVGVKFFIGVGGVVHEYILVDLVKHITDGVSLAHGII